MIGNPPAMWMVVSSIDPTYDYPTNGHGATSTTAGNSHLIIPASITALIAAPARRPNVTVTGYLIVTGPVAAATLTIESHDGTFAHASTIPIGTTAISTATYVPIGGPGGIGMGGGGGLRCKVSAAMTINVYYRADD